ncbi:MAG: hypothetical protein ACI8P0_002390 [Planctomycetaceae bacterium]|jgi:hypothetical protein
MSTAINAISDERLTFVRSKAESRSTVSDVRYKKASEAERVRMDLWDELFDSIGEWKRIDGQIDDDGIEWPTAVSCERCTTLFMQLEESSPELIGFGRLVPDGDGGIAFEARIQKQLLRYEISDAGSVSRLFIDHGRVMSHEVLEVV